MISKSIGENIIKKKYSFFFRIIYLFIFIVIFCGKYLHCSLNNLTLHFCGCDISALHTPVLNLATIMYRHLLGAYCFININSSGKSFTQKCALTQHILIHTADKNMISEYVESHFHRNAILLRICLFTLELKYLEINHLLWSYIFHRNGG